ncbi:MAG TPA: hypothetical protein VJ225_03265 [Nitrososphaeraceae archaeon]|nr:hypothetical protein [Nitrososphaeraceae archaeon]
MFGNFEMVNLTYNDIQLHIQQNNVDILTHNFGDVYPKDNIRNRRFQMLWMSSYRSRSQSEETGGTREKEMSLCYDGEKWLMITLSIVTISLTVGLVLVGEAYGQPYLTPKQREATINYYFEHADRPNPIQDLTDKGLLDPSYQGQDCI